MEKYSYKTEKLTIDIEGDSNIMSLSFKGNIDEDFAWKDLLKQKSKNYIIDFNGVTLLNSCGIREWIHFLNHLGSDSQVTYINCPPVIIHQMNIVAGLLSQNAIVETFYAPYFDEEEDQEVLKLLKVCDIKNGKAPRMVSETTGRDLEFDGIEKQYFHFISLQGKFTPPPLPR